MDENERGNTIPADGDFQEMPFVSDTKSTGSARPKKIIKAEELGQGSPNLKSDEYPDHEPEIIPMMNAKIVEGLEIRCKCGEKLIVHFDKDEREPPNN